MNPLKKTCWILSLTVGTCMLLNGCVTESKQDKELVVQEVVQRQESRQQSLQLYRDALSEYQAGHVQKAHELLRKTVEIDNRNASAWVFLGMLEYEQNELFDAAHAMNEALRLEPRRFEPHYNLGLIYETAGKYTQAISRYEKALEMAPDEPAVMENLVRCYMKIAPEKEKTLTLVNRALLVERRTEWKEWLQRQKSSLI